MQERIEKLTMDWFLMEPALLKVLMSHTMTVNTEMRCPVRCGNRRIEYNPALCQEISDDVFAETMKAECIRILLKHPYERQPDNCSAMSVTLGSNCVVADNYSMKHIELLHPKDFQLESGQHFEYYAREIEKLLPKQQNPSGGGSAGDKQNSDNSNSGNENPDDGDSNENSGNGNSNENSNSGNSNNSSASGDTTGSSSNSNNSSTGSSSYGNSGKEGANNKTGANRPANAQSLNDQSSLWQEDPMASAEVNELIQKLETSNGWGSIPGNLVGKIVASTKVKIDYRHVIQLFRTEVLSSMRRLTRMRPNRRSGFQNYGSVYKLTSRLLVAIDVSGSTTDEMVGEFFGVINKFFKYGIEEIDVIQFEVDVKGEPQSMKKAKKDKIDIVGRGGTNFQPVFDFAAEHKNRYQGLIVLTDGHAPEIILPDYFNTPVLWVLPEEINYENEWLSKYGKVCVINR